MSLTGFKNPPPHPSGLAYRPCVGIMLLNRFSQAFVGNRIDSPGEYWQMPQGGIDEGEDPRDAALRELHEETGLTADKVRVLGHIENWLHYDLPDDKVGMMWGGAYCGQKQRWYAMRFRGSEDEIDISGKASGSDPEFSEWKWAERSELPEMIVPFKRDLYAEVVKQFYAFR
ncbi:MAG: RNA pyrophosphohydrolase [Pacificimonas sp.]